LLSGQVGLSESGGCFATNRLGDVMYGFKVRRGIKVNPNIQCAINPDNILKPNAVHQSHNILALGMRLSIEVGAALGLPVWR